MKKPKNPARWALLIGIGIALGYLLRGGATEPSPAPVQSSAPAVESVWTCSMHPQIRRSEPGLCPICAMDLVLSEPTSGESGGGLRQLSVSPEQRELMRIRTTTVERRSVETEIRMVGKIDYDETRLAYITAWVPGRIDQLYVDYTGVSVSAGDHMVNLYSPDLYSAQQELLQASRAVAQSHLPALRSSTAATLDAARERLRQWGLSDEQIEAVEESGEAAAHTTLHAPVGGLVIQKNVQEGMYVDVETRIFTIADLDQVWVKFDAYESDLAWLRFGQEVTFETEAYPGEVFRGTISFIDPMLDPRTRTVKVRVVADNRAGRLKPAMFVRATIRASVAGRGKVLDPSLVGKWISPMHPEIVKDGPGACDVCGQLADIRYERGPQAIKSEDTFLLGYVVFDKRLGFAETDVVEECQELLQAKVDSGELLLPAGVSYSFAGNYENQIRSQKTLAMVLPVALFLIFLILYLQFQSVPTALMIFTSIAVAWAGGFLLVWFYGRAGFLDFEVFGANLRELFGVGPINLSVAIWVGFLALFGIASDDGVLIASYLDQSFASGAPGSAAEIRRRVVEAAARRIRPALMTSATTVLALLPVLSSRGRGSDIMVPMAIPTFGGMLVVLVSVFVVPVLYSAARELRL